MLGQYESAMPLARQCLSSYQTRGVKWGIGNASHVLGSVALVRGDNRKASRELHRAVKGLRTNMLYGGYVARSLAALCMASYKCGDEVAARRHLGEALRIVDKLKSNLNLSRTLPAAALLIAGKEEVQRAVEIYALASQHPYVANSQWFEDVAGKQIAALAEGLPPEVAEAARKRGRERDPWETAEELLVEVESERTLI